MKVAVCGSRDIFNKEVVFGVLDEIMKFIYTMYIAPDDWQWVERIVSGGANGIDTLAEKYAKDRGYKTRIFYANWDRYGNRAGPIRNREIADYADILICIRRKDSKGSKDMIKAMNDADKPVISFIWGD